MHAFVQMSLLGTCIAELGVGSVVSYLNTIDRNAFYLNNFSYVMMK